MKLNLGCGRERMNGYVNVDISQPADVVHDLNVMPWPWGDGSVAEIRAFDVVEHLTCLLVPFMDECWRLLAPGGVLVVRTGTHEHPQFWADPTHVRPYTLEAFEYFDPEKQWFQKYGQYYTKRHWRIIQTAKPSPGMIQARLTPIKETG